MNTDKDKTLHSGAPDKEARTVSLRTVLKNTKRALFGIFLVFCAALIVVTGWLAIDKFILKSKVPSFAGYSVLVVATGSMEGTIMEGDLVLIKDTGDYKIGDIITFAHEDETVPTTHRIINYSNDGTDMYVTRGDANNTKDRRNVSEDEIYGEVVLTMHKLGLFVGWLTEGGGYIYLVAALLIIVLGVYLIKDESNRVLQLEEQAEGENTDADTDADTEKASDGADEAEKDADNS